MNTDRAQIAALGALHAPAPTPVADPMLTPAEARVVALATVSLGPDDGDTVTRAQAHAWAMMGRPHPIREAHAARAEMGRAKYGVVLRLGWPKATAGALQEALDLEVYLEADTGATAEEKALARRLTDSLFARLVRSEEGRG